MSDPFSVLGLEESATADDVRRARRDLAKSSHPDHGGDGRQMREVNVAAAEALRRIDARGSEPVEESGGRGVPGSADPGSVGSATDAEPDGRRFDVPSFTVEALPVETFEGLLLAAGVLGEVIDDEPPYELTVSMAPPVHCWCRLEVVPDAGASTVSLAVAPVEGTMAPSLDVVRDAWIAELNLLDWSQL